MLKPCVVRGCPELVERRESHCPAHQPKPWDGWSYRDNLDVPVREWERLKRIVWKQSRGKCFRCGRPGREVHHIVPRAQGGATVLPNLVLLCKDCHAGETAAMPRVR